MKRVKTVQIIFILLGMSLTAIGQISGNNDKIKSIIVTEVKYDMLINKEYSESETYFDLKGNIIEEIKYKQGKIDKHFKYQYDENSNKILEEEFDSSGRIKESSEYVYEKGVRVEKTVFDSKKKIKSKKFYKYTTF